ncbi:MAG: long-chain-fatty-acid--CoA ligase [Legionellales bacterium]|nr:long-chain-fatty-acid--CoA ligase [Legionellales bacterium]
MDKIWLKNYPNNIPHEINPEAFQSVVDVFEQGVVKFKHNEAFENMGTSITYHQLDKLTQAFAAYLTETLSCKAGDRVAIMMPNLLQYPICLFGALRAGLTVVNVNPLYTRRELLHQVYDAGVETIIVLANFADTVQHVVAESKIKNVIITEIGDLFPSVKKTVINFAVKYLKKMVPDYHIPNAIKLTTVLEQGAKLPFKRLCIRPEDIAFLQYTGGTTGVAKGAILTHRNIIANLEQTSAWVKSILQEGKEIIITPLPLYHIFSLLANCLLFIKVGGKNILITNPRDIKDFVKTLKKVEKFTALTGVNTLFNALANNSEFKQLDFSHLKFALGGGMAVQKAVAEQWEKVTGHPLLEAYGLTETSPAVTINPLNMQHYNGSIGLPIPSTEISIRDDDGKEVTIGEVGELCVRGPQVMRGYWNKPEETKASFTQDGFLKTGDMASVDSNGFVYIRERKKDMIVVSGFNVYPNEVESVIVSHPGVLEAAVVGVPQKISGEMVKAFIVKKDPDLTKEQVIAYCRENLTAYKVPKVVAFRDDLPKTNVGKILRRVLRDEAKTNSNE